MQVIVRLQDQGALRLDHLHDQALCELEGRGDLSITHIMPRWGRNADSVTRAGGSVRGAGSIGTAVGRDRVGDPAPLPSATGSRPVIAADPRQNTIRVPSDQAVWLSARDQLDVSLPRVG
jgi:hypothetical protein